MQRFCVSRERKPCFFLLLVRLTRNWNLSLLLRALDGFVTANAISNREGKISEIDSPTKQRRKNAAHWFLLLIAFVIFV